MDDFPIGERLRKARRRLRLSQTAVSAYIILQTRKDYNPGRISEMERGLRVIPTPILQIIAVMFQKVEELRKQRRHWTDVFFL